MNAEHETGVFVIFYDHVEIDISIDNNVEVGIQ